MRILIYGINYYPELTGVGKYTGEMAAWLSARSHEVRVITAPPYYPQWHIGQSYSAGAYREEVIDGVRIFRCPLWIPSNPGAIKRLLHLLSFAFSSIPALLKQRRWKPDLVIVIEPTFFVTPSSLIFAKFVRAKTWLHIQDFEIDAAFSLGILRGPVRYLAKWIEKKIVLQFDFVSSISNAMLKRVHDMGLSQSKTRLLPNWVDTAKLHPAAKDAHRFREEMFGARPSDRVVLYSGNMGEKQGLEMVIEVAHRLPAYKFVFCGEGTAKARIQLKAAELRLANVLFLPLQPLHDLPSLLCAADLHLVIQRRGTADLVMPSKLTGILSVGGAAVVTADPGTELYHLLSTYELGAVVPTEDILSLANKIDSLLHDDLMVAKYRAAARSYAEMYLDRDSILSKAFGIQEPSSHHKRDVVSHAN